MTASKPTGLAILLVLSLATAGHAATVGQWLFDDPGGLGTGVNIPGGGQLVDSSGNDLHFTYALQADPGGLRTFQYQNDVAGPIAGGGRTSLEAQSTRFGQCVPGACTDDDGLMESVASDRFNLAQTGELTIEFWHKNKETGFQNVLATVSPPVEDADHSNRINIQTGIDSLGVPPGFRPTYAYSWSVVDDAGVGGSQAPWQPGREKTAADYNAPQGVEPVVEDVWKHVAYTASTNTGDTHIYVDGVEVAFWEDGLTGRDFQNFVPTDTEACQGAGKACMRLLANAITDNFNGFAFIDELRISDVALVPGDGSGDGVLAWAASLATAAPMGPLDGDANNDNLVTGQDLIAVQQSFGKVYPPGMAEGCDGMGMGDANDDCLVTGADLISVQQNFGKVLMMAAVPEPATAALLTLSAVALIIRRRQRIQSAAGGI